MKSIVFIIQIYANVTIELIVIILEIFIFRFGKGRLEEMWESACTNQRPADS